MSASSPSDHHQMAQDCANREAKLSEWERGFVQSITEQLERGASLSDRQAATLDKIWERVT